MITVASVAMVLGGVGVVAAAQRAPAGVARLESAGGLLVFAGLLTMGFVLASAAA